MRCNTNKICRSDAEISVIYMHYMKHQFHWQNIYFIFKLFRMRSVVQHVMPVRVIKIRTKSDGNLGQNT